MTKIPIITGPTASGKSKVAMDRALKQGLTILNADAVQLYKGLPILTACPSDSDFQLVPHKLYNFVDPFSPWSVIDWIKAIQTEIELAPHKVLIVGGSGFYIKALTEGLSPIPDIPENIREQLLHQIKEESISPLYAELKQRDPVLAARLNPADTQRICRGVEVFRGTGTALSVWQEMPKEKLPFDFEVTLILRERDVLYDRCNQRFLQMIDQGVIDEVRHFITNTQDQENALRKALGFKEIQAFLRDEISLHEAITLAQTATRQFAKRQVTWFRHQLQ